MLSFFSGWSPELQAAAIGALVGGCLGILGAILGGWMQGRAWYGYELKRAAGEKHEHAIQTALEWSVNGRKDSLRHADLHGADLRGVNLGQGMGDEPTADLSYANLTHANLTARQFDTRQLGGSPTVKRQVEARKTRECGPEGR